LFIGISKLKLRRKFEGLDISSKKGIIEEKILDYYLSVGSYFRGGESNICCGWASCPNDKGVSKRFPVIKRDETSSWFDELDN
jgi:hypothetical protein